MFSSFPDSGIPFDSLSLSSCSELGSIGWGSRKGLEHIGNKSFIKRMMVRKRKREHDTAPNIVFPYAYGKIDEVE